MYIYLHLKEWTIDRPQKELFLMDNNIGRYLPTSLLREEQNFALLNKNKPMIFRDSNSFHETQGCEHCSKITNKLRLAQKLKEMSRMYKPSNAEVMK